MTDQKGRAWAFQGLRDVKVRSGGTLIRSAADIGSYSGAVYKGPTGDHVYERIATVTATGYVVDRETELIVSSPSATIRIGLPTADQQKGRRVIVARSLGVGYELIISAGVGAGESINGANTLTATGSNVGISIITFASGWLTI